MKCPECGKEVKGKTCSFCGFNVSQFLENNTTDVYESEVQKSILVFRILVIISILVMVGSIFTYWFMPLAVILLILNIIILVKKLNKKINKKQYITFCFLVVAVAMLSGISFTEKISEVYTIKTAYSNYSDILDVSLPKKDPEYEYISNLDKGYRIERFTFELTNEEVDTLLKSNEKFIVITESAKEIKIYNTWYNDIKSGYILYYDMINNRYQDIEDADLYHYAVIIIQNNKVVVEEITKTPTNVETGE